MLYQLSYTRDSAGHITQLPTGLASGGDVRVPVGERIAPWCVVFRGFPVGEAAHQANLMVECKMKTRDFWRVCK